MREQADHAPQPAVIEASLILGRELVDRGELDAAIRCFERITEFNPEMFDSQRLLAGALVEKGAVKRAIGHYHCALAINPHSTEVMLELADALAKLGRKPAAAALRERARALGGAA